MYKFDKVVNQFLEIGTSDITFMGRDRELKWLAFSLYPLSFFLYSPFKHAKNCVLLGTQYIGCRNILNTSCNNAKTQKVFYKYSLTYTESSLNLFFYWFMINTKNMSVYLYVYPVTPICPIDTRNYIYI